MMKVMKFNNLKRSSKIIVAFLIGAISAIALSEIFEVLQIDDKINNKSDTHPIIVNNNKEALYLGNTEHTALIATKSAVVAAILGAVAIAT